MKEVRAAAELLLAEGVAVTVWSVTSYGELARDGRAAERAKRLDPQTARRPYVAEAFENAEGSLCLPATTWAPSRTDPVAGYPAPTRCWARTVMAYRTRDALRDHFEVSAAWIAHAALGLLEERALFLRARPWPLRSPGPEPGEGGFGKLLKTVPWPPKAPVTVLVEGP